MKKKVFEQVKSEISPEKTKALLSELEDELHRMADRVEIDEDEGEIKIEGLKGKLCLASGKLRIDGDKGKYTIEGEIDGKPDMIYWGIFGFGVVLFLIAIFAFWPALLVSIAIDVALVIIFSNGVQTVGKSLENKFHDAVKNI